MRTISDDDELLSEYECLTPTEDSVAKDRWSIEETEGGERPESDIASNHAEREADNRRHDPCNDEQVASHSHRQERSNEIRSLASGNVALMETNRAPVLRKLDRKATPRKVEIYI
jgi:hypothetical protein